MLQGPFVIEGQHLGVSNSIGIARYPDDGFAAEKLLQRADMAMYRAKQGGGGVAHYRAEQEPYHPAGAARSPRPAPLGGLPRPPGGR